jgi:hypothetical protein
MRTHGVTAEDLDQVEVPAELSDAFESAIDTPPEKPAPTKRAPMRGFVVRG